MQVAVLPAGYCPAAMLLTLCIAAFCVGRADCQCQYQLNRMSLAVGCVSTAYDL